MKSETPVNIAIGFVLILYLVLAIATAYMKGYDDGWYDGFFSRTTLMERAN